MCYGSFKLFSSEGYTQRDFNFPFINVIAMDSCTIGNLLSLVPFCNCSRAADLIITNAGCWNLLFGSG